MSTIGYINISLETFGGLLSLIFIFCLYITRRKRELLEQRYIRMLICNTILLFSDAAAWLFKGRLDGYSIIIVRLSNFLVFVLGYVIVALFMDYLISFLVVKNAPVTKKPLYIIWAIVFVAVGLTVLSQFNGMYYLIDEQNIYHRQDLFWLSQVFGIVGMALNGGVILCHRRYFLKKEIIIFCVYIFLPVAALLFQILFYSIAVLYLVTSICLLCIYLSIQLELSRELEQRELELEKSRTDLMMSQIQPHFLHNSLLSIRQLCEIEPAKASVALEHFAYYLRDNLYAVSGPPLIPFKKELEHLLDYLYLEKMRFEEQISVKWEIGFTDFLIPPLTLQPIAENAVCHGLTGKDGGGSLTFCTETVGDSIIITITDDGEGFDVTAEPDNSRPHIGIANVRKRLEAQCGGTLCIRSAIGEGTAVTITLPGKATL